MHGRLGQQLRAGVRLQDCRLPAQPAGKCVGDLVRGHATLAQQTLVEIEPHVYWFQQPLISRVFAAELIAQKLSCAFHEGLVRGMAEAASGGEVSVQLKPFVAPGVCRVDLTPRLDSIKPPAPPRKRRQ